MSLRCEHELVIKSRELKSSGRRLIMHGGVVLYDTSPRYGSLRRARSQELIQRTLFTACMHSFRAQKTCLPDIPMDVIMLTRHSSILAARPSSTMLFTLDTQSLPFVGSISGQ